MTADQYLHGILLREAVDAGPNSPLLGVQSTLMPTLRQWAGDHLLGVYPSGSFMKGTAVRSGTDIDLFLSLSEHTNETLKEVYNKLFDCLTSAGYSPQRQNVSLNITVPRTAGAQAPIAAAWNSEYSVDLVPGKRQNALSSDHSLYRRRADTWTKTNISTHARMVVGAGRANEIRIVKLWRNQNGLDFPSFYLELSVIRALAPKPLPGLLSYDPGATLAQRVMTVFDYLVDSFPAARIADPANSNNIISDDLTAHEKAKVSAAAKAARVAAASSWEDIVR
ncbi:MAG TPA: nucleotidyltransferase [Candidatus Bathyarchaeia archaeon]|nr:nucleotidyltransferase [Candidatus Bathyarchaeia archaeon]